MIMSISSFASDMESINIDILEYWYISFYFTSEHTISRQQCPVRWEERRQRRTSCQRRSAINANVWTVNHPQLSPFVKLQYESHSCVPWTIKQSPFNVVKRNSVCLLRLNAEIVWCWEFMFEITCVYSHTYMISFIF